MIWPFKKKEVKRCPCGKFIGEGAGVVQYRCLDEDSQEFIINQMDICKDCADDLDREADQSLKD
jgi:hypothetical protein